MKDKHNDSLPAGKLPAPLLSDLLSELPIVDPQLLLGPAVGEDAAVIEFSPGSERLLVAKSDPVTFATDQIGYYAVNICANDLAVTGATPQFYLPTILLPAGQTDTALLRRVFRQIGAACRDLGIVVAGGHTEITHAVSQPVLAGTMLGYVRRTGYVSSQGCRPGDVILMAGLSPVEGASIIARERRSELLQRGWSSDELDRAAEYLYDPGISIFRPARLAAQTRCVTAMHDPTEGGIATGLLELALAGGVGLVVDLDAIPMSDLARRLCVEFDLDPLGTIASGALLATSAPEHAQTILYAWRQDNWPSAVIGEITSHGEDLTARHHGLSCEFPRFSADEITKLWQ